MKQKKENINNLWCKTTFLKSDFKVFSRRRKCQKMRIKNRNYFFLLRKQLHWLTMYIRERKTRNHNKNSLACEVGNRQWSMKMSRCGKITELNAFGFASKWDLKYFSENFDFLVKRCLFFRTASGCPIVLKMRRLAQFWSLFRVCWKTRRTTGLALKWKLRKSFQFLSDKKIWNKFSRQATQFRNLPALHILWMSHSFIAFVSQSRDFCSILLDTFNYKCNK